MNAFILMVPLLLIRFGLLGMIGKAALRRASVFAPLEGGERFAYFLYQASNVIIIFYPLFLKIETKQPSLIIGLIIYILGVLVMVISTISFANPNHDGLNVNGIYRFSRNPMYIAYFVYFLGCVVLTSSILLFLTLLAFQISAHWIILSEERWCIKKFGRQYVNYMNRVNRYF